MRTLTHLLLVILAVEGYWDVRWTTAVQEGMTLSVITQCEAGEPYRAVTTFPLERLETTKRVRQHFIPSTSRDCWVGAGIYPEGNDTSPIEWAIAKL